MMTCSIKLGQCNDAPPPSFPRLARRVLALDIVILKLDRQQYEPQFSHCVKTNTSGGQKHSAAVNEKKLHLNTMYDLELCV